MKKVVLSLLLLIVCSSFLSLPSFADEIEEDYLDIATNYCIMGDYNSAMEYLDKILEINPKNEKVMNLKRGLLHVISKDKKSFVSGVNPLIKQAQEYKRVGDEKMEVATLQKATQEENSYLAYYYLGNFYRSKKYYSKAIDAYNSAVSARADFAQAYLALAIVSYNLGKYESVINSIDKYLTFNQNDDLAFALKSRAELELNMIQEALNDNNMALQINNSPEYRFDKAKILYKLDKYEESKKLFSSLLPEIQNSKIYEYMGLCDYAMKDYTNALMNIDKAIILSDDDEYLENKYNEIKAMLENN